MSPTVECPACLGTGQEDPLSDLAGVECLECGGSGWIWDDPEIEAEEVDEPWPEDTDAATS
jgi:DnaJ-class molecular chaperone